MEMHDVVNFTVLKTNSKQVGSAAEGVVAFCLAPCPGAANF